MKVGTMHANDSIVWTNSSRGCDDEEPIGVFVALLLLVVAMGMRG